MINDFLARYEKDLIDKNTKRVTEQVTEQVTKTVTDNVTRKIAKNLKDILPDLKSPNALACLFRKFKNFNL